MAEQDDQKHWLVRPQTIRLLIVIAIVVLVLTFAASALIPIDGHFGIDGYFGFFAIYGFVTCAAMVVFAKLLGFVLKRRDDYYDT